MRTPRFEAWLASALEFDGVPAGSPETLCGRLAAFFKARPLVWVDGRELATVAGSYGWRTRVSDLRRPPYNLTIENRQRRATLWVVSEYRFVPAAPSQDPAGAPPPAGDRV